ncbi:MAG TPA: hypothetical protein VGC79_08310 [Polyangiaceae bacterium]
MTKRTERQRQFAQAQREAILRAIVPADQQQLPRRKTRHEQHAPKR